MRLPLLLLPKEISDLCVGYVIAFKYKHLGTFFKAQWIAADCEWAPDRSNHSSYNLPIIWNSTFSVTYRLDNTHVFITALDGKEIF